MFADSSANRELMPKAGVVRGREKKMASAEAPSQLLQKRKLPWAVLGGFFPVFFITAKAAAPHGVPSHAILARHHDGAIQVFFRVAQDFCRGNSACESLSPVCSIAGPIDAAKFSFTASAS